MTLSVEKPHETPMTINHKPMELMPPIEQSAQTQQESKDYNSDLYLQRQQIQE